MPSTSRVERRWYPLLEPKQQAVLSYIGLRRGVGLIGIALPFVLWLGGLSVGIGWQPSISAYYHTGMRDILVGSLWAIGVFMFSYKFGKLDDWLGNVVAIAAIGLALAPAPLPGATGWQAAAGILHVILGAVFFLALAFFALFLFTRTRPNGQVTPEKRIRNRVYVTSGLLIIACLVLIVLTPYIFNADIETRFNPVFWWETIAILSFGVSWFVKGETLWPDR